MATAETARLIATLELKDQFSKGMGKVFGTLDKAEGRFGAIGLKAQQGVANFSRNIGLIGLAAAGGITAAVKTGLDDLAELESAIASVDGAIETLGLTGQVTGKQVADWANQIESDIGAAFDDKEITSAAASLIRYGKVTTDNLQPALVVMTDLAAKTGDVDSAATLLAKALADPTKAAGKLARTGIILTKQQQDQIKAMVEAGNVAGAQALLLDELAKSTEGAARASQGPYQRALSTLADVGEDARKALAEGFLPVIEKVANRLGTAVADPAFINGLREFGTTLAAGLDDLIDIAASLPWTTIGDSLKLAGQGARVVLGAFTSLPPWVQTAVITGWGLNKLTGGALGGIIGELGKGLIKGVLGMNAGVVNINAGVVNGGVPGVPGAPTGGKGGIGGAVATAAKIVLPVAIASIAAEAAASIAGVTRGSGDREINELGNITRTVTDVGQRIENVKGAIAALEVRAAGGDATAQRQLEEQRKVLVGLLGETSKGNARSDARRDRQIAIGLATQRAGERVEGKVSQQIAADARYAGGQASAAAAVRAAIERNVVASRAAGQQAAFAIRDKDLSVKNNINLSVSTKVSVSESINAQTTFKKAGNYAF